MSHTKDLLMARASERNFLYQPIKEADLEEMVYAINSSPSGKNINGTSVIVINDQELKMKIYNLVPEKSKNHYRQIKDAGAIFLFLADSNRVLEAAKILKASQEKLFYQGFDNYVYSYGSAFIQMQSLVIQALDLGYGTCYMSSLKQDFFIDFFNQELGLKGTVFPVGAVAVGTISQKARVKPKVNRVFFNHYDHTRLVQDLKDFESALMQDRKETYTKNQFLHHLVDAYQNDALDYYKESLQKVYPFIKKIN